MSRWCREKSRWKKKRVVFKNCALFTDCVCEINNTQIDNAKHIDVVMSMYSLIQYNNSYSETSVKLNQMII